MGSQPAPMMRNMKSRGDRVAASWGRRNSRFRPSPWILLVRPMTRGLAAITPSCAGWIWQSFSRGQPFLASISMVSDERQMPMEAASSCPRTLASFQSASRWVIITVSVEFRRPS